MATSNPTQTGGRSFALAALLTAFTAGAAHAQTVDQVHRAIAGIADHYQALYTASNNLSAMGVGQDAKIVEYAASTVSLFSLATAGVAEVGSTLSQMKDPEDAKVIRIQLQKSSLRCLGVMDTNIKIMNDLMPLVHAPAALAEATKMRDEMVAIRRQIQSIQVTGQ